MGHLTNGRTFWGLALGVLVDGDDDGAFGDGDDDDEDLGPLLLGAELDVGLGYLLDAVLWGLELEPVWSLELGPVWGLELGPVRGLELGSVLAVEVGPLLAFAVSCAVFRCLPYSVQTLSLAMPECAVLHLSWHKSLFSPVCLLP